MMCVEVGFANGRPLSLDQCTPAIYMCVCVCVFRISFFVTDSNAIAMITYRACTMPLDLWKLCHCGKIPPPIQWPHSDTYTSVNSLDID